MAFKRSGVRTSLAPHNPLNSFFFTYSLLNLSHCISDSKTLIFTSFYRSIYGELILKTKPFKNEKLTDFSKKVNIDKQNQALAQVRKRLGKTFDIIIGGKKIKTKNKLHSFNPSNKKEIVATFYKGTPDLVDRAVETASYKFNEWKNVP